MTILGRGLASLIPKRNSENAEDMLEQIDSMEDLAEEQTEAPAVEQPAAPVIEEEVETPEPVTPATEETAEVSTKQLNVVEEFEDLDALESSPLPSKPNVTPLTIDPETGSLKETAAPKAAAVVGVAASVTKQAAKVAKTTATIRPLKKQIKKVEKVAIAQEETTTVITEDIGITKPSVPIVPTEKEMDRAISDRHEERVEQIALGDIEVNPLQPRRSFDAGEMEDLVQSIRQHGILQPLVVMRKSAGGYELVAGERRLRAAKQLGWEKVPCVVRIDIQTDRGRLEMALIENIQREDLNPVEEAMGYQRLHDEFGLTHEEIGERVGRSRVGITNVLRVLQLPAEIQRGLAEGKISAGHARAILMIPDEEKQLRFYHHLLDEGLTVRKAETRARRIQRTMKLNDPMRKKTRGRPQLALKYDGPLEEKYGYNARVKFIEDKNRFEVIFQAFSEKEAEELVGRLLGEAPLPEHIDEDVIESDTEAE
ncbi:MAG: ParB/RepB/Spo0J family partition protein [Candidatus Andersenbacteria bacterium]